MNRAKAIFRSAIVLYFIIALEVLIMISPFAGFFYSVFNPFLLEIARYPATRWLSAFYLPHMILPESDFLRFVRIMGSVMLLAGAAVFLVCAIQVYSAKFRRKGPVLAGLYTVIRHPQYVGLALAGLGLSILWPRFLTLMLWLLMSFVYYILARDEERRMLKVHGETYRKYMEKTGMFLPIAIERRLAPSSRFGKLMMGICFITIVLAGAFLLRAYTINQLTLWTKAQNVVGVAILPEDGFKMDHRMPAILNIDGIREKLQQNKDYLVYFMPRDYVMQGMIADTGETWMLYKQHHTMSMITDWVFHPFRHLREGHHAMHGQMSMQHHTAMSMTGGVIRRLIFLSIEDVKVDSPADLFSINALRVPQFMADVEVHNGLLLDVRELPHGSGWGTVPTPVF